METSGRSARGDQSVGPIAALDGRHELAYPSGPKATASLKAQWDYVHAIPMLRNGTCWGVYWNATLPFSDFGGESDADGAGAKHDYTNGELVALFDAKSPSLPFVYADFAWEHCHSEMEMFGPATRGPERPLSASA